jgi:hypothetical protein
MDNDEQVKKMIRVIARQFAVVLACRYGRQRQETRIVFASAVQDELDQLDRDANDCLDGK